MSLFNWPLLVTAILLGMGLGIQAPINAWIGKRLGSPYWGAGFSISISLVVILLFVFVMVRTIPSAETIWNAPWWVWLGGIFGAMFVAGAIVLGPRMGMALFFTCVVFGQVSISLLINRFGWFEIQIPRTQFFKNSRSTFGDRRNPFDSKRGIRIIQFIGMSFRTGLMIEPNHQRSFSRDIRETRFYGGGKADFLR